MEWMLLILLCISIVRKRLVEKRRICRHCSLSVAVNVDVVNQALNLVLVQLLAEVHHDHAQLLSIYEPIPVLEKGT